MRLRKLLYYFIALSLILSLMPEIAVSALADGDITQNVSSQTGSSITQAVAAWTDDDTTKNVPQIEAADEDTVPEKLVEEYAVPEALIDANVDAVKEALIDADAIPKALIDADAIPEELVDADAIPEELIDADAVPEELVSAPEAGGDDVSVSTEAELVSAVSAGGRILLDGDIQLDSCLAVTARASAAATRDTAARSKSMAELSIRRPAILARASAPERLTANGSSPPLTSS